VGAGTKTGTPAEQGELVPINKEKLIEHLNSEWEKKWGTRRNRLREMGEWFYGGEPDEEMVRDMRKLYTEAYLEGATDLLETILTFDADMQGVAALEALMHRFTVEA